MKLTNKQKEVIKDIQCGACICTDSSMKGAVISYPTSLGGKQYHINNRVFWNLVDKGLIAQGGHREHFNYLLTTVAEKLKL